MLFNVMMLIGCGDSKEDTGFFSTCTIQPLK